MARDFKKMKAVYNTAKVGNSEYLKVPENTKRRIRILPHKKELLDEEGFQESFIQKVYVHGLTDQDGNFTSFKCPKLNNGDPCKACDLVNKLYATKNKENIDLATELRAKERSMLQCICRDSDVEKYKVYLMEIPGSVSTNILNDLEKLNEESEDGMDIDGGRDFILEKIREKGKMYPNWKSTYAPKSSPLLADGEEGELDKIIEEMKNLEDLIIYLSDEKIDTMYKKYFEILEEKEEVNNTGEEEKEVEFPQCHGTHEESSECKKCKFQKSCMELTYKPKSKKQPVSEKTPEKVIEEPKEKKMSLKEKLAQSRAGK